MDILAVDISTFHTFDFLSKGESEKELLDRANEYKERDIARFKEIISDFKSQGKDTDYYEKRLAATEQINYKIMTWDEFQSGQKKYLLSDDLKEITKKEYYKALNVLPPIQWCTIAGVEMFCLSEMYTDTYTTQYARCNEKYYCKMVDTTDKETWIHNLL